jgi:hypothetical protein
MTIYQIVADSSRTFGLRNKETGQFDHQGFASRAVVRSFFKLHFGWNAAYKLEG